jgi:endonuclease/exonuclease/phosphatase family metal-dependent hydrolase
MVDRDLVGMGYAPYLIEGRDTFTRQDVGILSRVAVDTTFRTDERVPVAGGDESYGVSKNLVVRFSLDGQPVSLLALHFLAQPENAERRRRRETQAEVIRRAIVRELAAGRGVIVAGDFNDYDGTVPDARGARPITLVLETIRSAGAGPGDDLVNALIDVPQRSRFTVGRDYDSDGAVEPHETSAVDHVLLSPQLYRRVQDVRVAHLPEARAASDHLPVVVTLGGD